MVTQHGRQLKKADWPPVKGIPESAFLRYNPPAQRLMEHGLPMSYIHMKNNNLLILGPKTKTEHAKYENNMPATLFLKLNFHCMKKMVLYYR